MWNLGLGLLAVLLFSVKKGSLPSPGARGREEEEGGDRFVLAGELVRNGGEGRGKGRRRQRKVGWGRGGECAACEVSGEDSVTCECVYQV